MTALCLPPPRSSFFSQQVPPLSVCLFAVLSWAAESASEHPLGAAIAGFAKAELAVGGFPAVDDFLALPGRGVRCQYARQRLLVGNVGLLAEHGVAVPAVVAQRVQELEEEGKTVMLAAVRGPGLDPGAF